MRTANRPTSATHSPSALNTRTTHWLLALIFCGGVVIAYLPIWKAGFIWDDDQHLTANPVILEPDGLARIWTSPAANYFPLTLTNFWTQHALWGLDPLPYHLVNLGLHLACGLLLWQVLERLRVPGGWLGALLWTIHPVQVDSVAWISELKNTQSCLFFLLAILAFMRWLPASPSLRQWGRPALWYGIALICTVFAILSKSSTVVLPAVLALVTWWQSKRWTWRDALWLGPFLAVSLSAAIWTIWEQKYHSRALGPDWEQTPAERIILSGQAVWFYLGKLVWPTPLTFIYPRWTLEADHLLSYLPVAVVLGLGVTLWMKRDTWGRPWFLGFGYFWLCLFPVLGFFSIFYFRYSYVADHFQYLASIGPLVLLGAALHTALSRSGRGTGAKAAVFLAPVAVLGALTWHQCHDYLSDYTIWQSTLRDDPRSWMPLNSLGNLYRTEGKLADAITQYESALAVRPHYAMAHYNLALVMSQQGRHDAAFDHLQAAVRDDPAYVEALVNLGGEYRRRGRTTEAKQQYEAALLSDPNYFPALYNLGNILMQEGRLSEAELRYSAALRQRPNLAEAHNNLGIVLAQLGRPSEAVAHFETALKLDPRFVRARENLESMRAPQNAAPSQK